jgi:Flp pilus assembly protein TadD
MTQSIAKGPLVLCLFLAAACPVRGQTTPSPVGGTAATDSLANAGGPQSQIEEALSKTGDLDMIIKAFVELRLSTRHWFSSREPDIVSAMNKATDQILDPELLRDDVSLFVASSLSDEQKAQTLAWASLPSTAAINRILVNIQWLPPSKQTYPPTPSRIDKIGRIVRATSLQKRIGLTEVMLEAISGDVARTINPTAEHPTRPTPPPGTVTSPEESKFLSHCVAQLGHIPEPDLDEFLAFAESEAGLRYFDAVLTALRFEVGDWKQEFLASVQTILKPGRLAASIPEGYVEELVDREIRIEPAMEQSGDLRLVMSVLSDLRPLVESWIQQLHPEAMPKMKPELDRILAAEALRESLAIEMGSYLAAGGIEEVEAWAANPRMQAINAVLADPFGSQPVGAPSQPSPDLREKLLRLTRATLVVDRLKDLERSKFSLAVELTAAIAPELTLDPVPYDAPTPSDHEMLVDRYLAPALSHIPEAEIDEFLAFAESPVGVRYFRGIDTAMQFSLARWRPELVASIQANAKRTSAQETSSFDELVELGKQLLSDGANVDARSVLLRAERLRPENSEVQMLLGEVATHLRGGPRPSRGQLRTETHPDYFSEAEHHLGRAIELDPSNARAHALLGRAKFLQSKDSEAEALIAKAKQLDPNLAWLLVNQADLASVQGRYDEAIALYREALARPEGEPNVHHWALVRSWVAFRESERLAEYSALARQYMKDHPEDLDYPLVFAEHLLYSGNDDAEALRVLERANPRRNPPLRNALMAKAMAGLAHSSHTRTGTFDAQSRAWLQQAVQLTAGSEERLVRDLAIEPARAEVMATVVRASRSPESLATVALNWAIFPRRMDVVKTLVEAGADLNAPLEVVPWPPLVQAAMSRDVDLFTLLLDLGADPAQARIEGELLSDWLERRSHDPSVAELLKALRKG